MAEELERGGFRDPAWVERWDVAVADLYLDAVTDAQAGRRPPEPWAVAFGAGDGLPPLRHVLLGMNAHINYDLAQSLLAVISEREFDDPELLASRHADHEHIDQVLVARVGAEDTELEAAGGPRSRTDRLLQPLNRLATKRFLRESRAKVWANTRLLDAARRTGPDAYAARLAELEQGRPGRDVSLRLSPPGGHRAQHAADLGRVVRGDRSGRPRADRYRLAAAIREDREERERELEARTLRHLPPE